MPIVESPLRTFSPAKCLVCNDTGSIERDPEELSWRIYNRKQNIWTDNHGMLQQLTKPTVTCLCKCRLKYLRLKQKRVGGTFDSVISPIPADVDDIEDLK